MGWFSKVIGSDKAMDTANSVLDGIKNGVDAIVFTDEEKAEYRQEGYKLWLKVLETTREESSVRSLTRRYIALLLVVAYTLLTFLAVVAYQFDSEFAAFVFSVAESKFGIMALGVATFYFGPSMLSRLRKPSP